MWLIIRELFEEVGVGGLDSILSARYLTPDTAKLILA